MKILIAILTVLIITLNTGCTDNNKTSVTHCTDNNKAFVTQNTTAEVIGTFSTGQYNALDNNVYYSFKSFDNEVWWHITAEEIGFIPLTDATYVLTYDTNGTTSENKLCDCLSEWECECEVYDDELINVKLYESEVTL